MCVGGREGILSIASGIQQPDVRRLCLAGLEVIGDTTYAKIPGIVMEGLTSDYQAAKSVARCQLMCDESESPSLLCGVLLYVLAL